MILICDGWTKDLGFATLMCEGWTQGSPNRPKLDGSGCTEPYQWLTGVVQSFDLECRRRRSEGEGKRGKRKAKKREEERKGKGKAGGGPLSLLESC